MTPAESNDPSTAAPSPYGPSEPQHGLSWLSDATDVRVVEGLTRRCSCCGAKKGDWCVELHTGNRRESLHLWRMGEVA